jgi:hypothetical protein
MNPGCWSCKFSDLANISLTGVGDVKVRYFCKLPCGKEVDGNDKSCDQYECFCGDCSRGDGNGYLFDPEELEVS